MILACAFAYNERPYIEEWVKYYRSQGCDLFVLDHMSNDGTYEYLKENGIARARFDNGGSFHLDQLQEELLYYIRYIKPYWVVYTGIDLFHLTPDGIKETIRKCEVAGCNALKMDVWFISNTGEPFGLPLQKHYFFGKQWKPLVMMRKYEDDIGLYADDITGSGNVYYVEGGVTINYGAGKPREVQEAKLARRQKAWAEGLREDFGHHYRDDKARDWRNDGVDIRNEPFFELVKKYIL